MDAIAWTHAGSSTLAAFSASAVECVEALTVILAAGTVRGWRDTLLGVAAALGTLLVAVAVFGAALARVPLDLLRVVVGVLLLLFGLRWLLKAILRGAGVVPLRDEAAAFANQLTSLRRHGAVRGWDRVAFGVAFQITMLEGAEIVFVVIGVGAGETGFLPASFGALAALLLVAAIGVLVRRPLSRVPENGLKLVVGVLLSALGAFWFGEGIGIEWPASDWSIPALIGGFLAAALVAVMVPDAREPRVRADRPARVRAVNWTSTIWRHGTGLLVDDGRLAAAVAAWLLSARLLLPRLTGGTGWGGPILFAGLAAIIVESAIRRAERSG